MERSPAAAKSAAAVELADALVELETELFERGPMQAEVAVLVSASIALADLAEEESPPTFDPLERLVNARLLALECDYLEGLPWLSERIAVRLMDADELEDARDLIAEDLELVEDPAFRARHFMRLAQIARTLGEMDEAELRLDSAEAELSKADDATTRALLLGTRVEFSLALGLRDRAARENLEELRMAGSLESLLPRACLHRADVLLAIGQYEGAKAYAAELLAGGVAWSDEERANLRLNAALADAERARLGSPSEEAEEALRTVLADEALPARNRELAELTLADLLLLRGELAESGEILARASPGGPRTRERLESDARRAALVHRHAVLAGDGEASRTSLAELRSAWTSFLDSWRGVEPSPEGVGFLEYGERRIALSELVRATLAESEGEAGRIQALELLLNAMELGSFARRHAYCHRPLSEVRDLLISPGSGLLIYLPGHDETHVFAVDRDKIVHEEVASPRKLREIGRTWRNGLDRPPLPDLPQGRESFLASGRLLGDALLPRSIRARVAGWRSVTIVGQSFLGYLPFEFLPFGEGFLGDEHAISELPSLPMGVILKERPSPEGFDADLFLVTDPAFGPEALARVERIPFEDRHLERLTRGFQEDRVHVVVHGEADRQSLLDPLVARSRILHLFTHGIDLPDRARSAGLALAPTREGDDGFLDCDFVETRVASALVVLISACRAGAGRTLRGDDSPAHLGGSFLWAGAKAVVFSPVSLELEAQSRFAGIVHRRLLAGDSVAESVRVARLELGRDPETAHPYYSRVHVLGLGDVRPFGRPARDR